LVQYNKIIPEFSRVSIDIEDDGQTLASVVDSNAIPSTIMEMSVDALELTTRTHNCLRRADITSIGQILQMDEKQLKAVRNLGDKSLDEIKDKVREMCLKAGYDPGGKWGKSSDDSQGVTVAAEDIEKEH
jgi:DNA-directed RNA polymerase subunit alpha